MYWLDDNGDCRVQQSAAEVPARELLRVISPRFAASCGNL
jgi:hypothetical protein